MLLLGTTLQHFVHLMAEPRKRSLPTRLPAQFACRQGLPSPREGHRQT